MSGSSLHGDFGVSLATQQKVLTEFLTLFPATLELSFFAMMFAVLVGVPAGAIAAVKRGSVFDQALMTVSLFGYSMPIFWWGLLLIMFVSVKLGLLPVSGRIDLINYYFDQPTGFMTIDALLSDQPGAFLDALRHLVLPAIVLGTVPLGVIARMTRSSMLEVLSEDYVRTARAKGLSPSRVIGVHALRNALLPVVTVIGLSVSGLMAGAVLTETIFSWPGVGKWLIELIGRRDYPALQGGVMLVSAVVILRQSDRRSHLRRDRPEDPPWPLTSPPRQSAAADESAAEVLAQPSPLAAFWAAFRENKGAVFGLAVFGLVVAAGVGGECRRALFADRTVPRRGAGPAGLGDGRLVALHSRHRRRRPRHAVAPHLRRAGLAVHRLLGDVRVVRHRRRARASRRDDRAGRRRRGHAAHGPHHGGAEPRARHSRRRGAGPEPRQHHRRGDDRLSAALRAPRARFGARRTQQGLRDRRARRRASVR